ncbi:MAG: hypothetical protein ACREUN_15160, partial [Burkholderiales bacterium]
MQVSVKLGLALATAALCGVVHAQSEVEQQWRERQALAEGKQPTSKTLGLVPGSNRPRPAAQGEPGKIEQLGIKQKELAEKKKQQ